MMGLQQVSKDKEVKEYLKKGKRLSEEQIDTFNKILKKDGRFPTFPVTKEVTDSTTPPFSEKLIIMFFISTSNQLGLTTLSHAMSISVRKDLATHYTLFIGEIMKYGSEGLEIMIKRGWMEQPLQPVRKKDV